VPADFRHRTGLLRIQVFKQLHSFKASLVLHDIVLSFVEEIMFEEVHRAVLVHGFTGFLNQAFHNLGENRVFL